MTSILSPPTQLPFQPSSNGRDIAVMMSGGVDSSVCALLMKQDGWNVVGVTMYIPTGNHSDLRRSCCGLEAGYVAQELGIPHYFLDVRAEFEQMVIEPFRQAYARGETPSPCVDCNTLIKFTLAWDAIERELGVSYLATGHYACVLRDNGYTFLARGADTQRDQSYFLYGIPLERLPYLRLPMGGYGKDEVRQIATEARLPVARRPDSMELCFAGEGDYRQALGDLTLVPGPVINRCGEVLGRHTGLAHYTVGQRKGLGIAAKEPLYVIAIDAASNTLIVGAYNEALQRDVSATDTNVLIPNALAQGSCLRGKIRSQGEPSPCEVTWVGDGALSIRFNDPQFAPTPGQRLVLYDEQSRVVAGGVIAMIPNSA